MPTPEQVKLLIQSYFEGPERFSSTALLIADSEDKQGNYALGEEIRNIVSEGEKLKSSKKSPKLNPLIKLNKSLRGLVLTQFPKLQFSSLVLSSELKKKLHILIHEYNRRNLLRTEGLIPRRKLLFIGPSGTGKSMTAKVLASTLSLPLYTVQFDRILSSFMGVTSTKIGQIFSMSERQPGVYLFDEFEAIGEDRSFDDDVGEMHRIVNSFSQSLANNNSDSIIIATTSLPRILDQSLIRRFDDILSYTLPSKHLRKELILNSLGTFLGRDYLWEDILKACDNFTHDEVVQSCHDARKYCILQRECEVSAEILIESIKNYQCRRNGIGLVGN